MNRRRKRSSNIKTVTSQKKIIRCRSKMQPVFESETCENFLKKEDRESDKFCKNCKHSF